VGAFLQRAEDILETAYQGESDQDILIVVDRQGGMRMMESAGWNLPAVVAEFGASAVYHVQRLADTVRVEGMAGAERCLLQKKNPRSTWGLGMPGMPAAGRPASQAMMLQTAALALA
jgi:hypothetical protein